MYNVSFEGLLSLADAAKIWGINESTVRKAIAAGRLVQGRDCQKYGKQWVVTVDAMAREFFGGYDPWKAAKQAVSSYGRPAELEGQITIPAPEDDDNPS